MSLQPAFQSPLMPATSLSFRLLREGLLSLPYSHSCLQPQAVRREMLCLPSVFASEKAVAEKAVHSHLCEERLRNFVDLPCGACLCLSERLRLKGPWKGGGRWAVTGGNPGEEQVEAVGRWVGGGGDVWWWWMMVVVVVIIRRETGAHERRRKMSQPTREEAQACWLLSSCVPRG